MIQIIEDQYSQNTYSGQILGNIESFKWKQSGINYHKLKEISEYLLIKIIIVYYNLLKF